MDTNDKARAEAAVSKEAAKVSAQAAKKAAADEINSIKDKAHEAKEKGKDVMENTKKNISGKAEDVKEKAHGFMDNLKDKAADLLNKGADKAAELADKLGTCLTDIPTDEYPKDICLIEQKSLFLHRKAITPCPRKQQQPLCAILWNRHHTMSHSQIPSSANAHS